MIVKDGMYLLYRRLSRVTVLCLSETFFCLVTVRIALDDLVRKEDRDRALGKTTVAKQKIIPTPDIGTMFFPITFIPLVYPIHIQSDSSGQENMGSP